MVTYSVVRSEYRPPGKVDPDKSITEMMNTDAFKTMRLKLMNGERAKECSVIVGLEKIAMLDLDRNVMLEQALKVKKRRDSII